MKCEKCTKHDLDAGMIGIKEYCKSCKKICSHCGNKPAKHNYSLTNIRLCNDCCELPFRVIWPSTLHKRDNPSLCIHKHLDMEISDIRRDNKGKLEYIYRCFTCGSYFKKDKPKKELFK